MAVWKLQCVSWKQLFPECEEVVACSDRTPSEHSSPSSQYTEGGSQEERKWLNPIENSTVTTRSAMSVHIFSIRHINIKAYVSSFSETGSTFTVLCFPFLFFIHLPPLSPTAPSFINQSFFCTPECSKCLTVEAPLRFKWLFRIKDAASKDWTHNAVAVHVGAVSEPVTGLLDFTNLSPSVAADTPNTAVRNNDGVL